MSGGGLRKHEDSRDRFVVVPSDTIDDEELSYRARGLLSHLLNRPDGWVVRSESLAASAKGKKGEGRDAVRSALRELGEHGYYRLERRTMRDGTHTMGTAISKRPVPEWITEWQEFGGDAVPVREQEDGTFTVTRKDPDGDPPKGPGTTEDTGDGIPGPGGEGSPGPGNPAPGDPDSGEPGAFTSTESQYRDTDQKDLRSFCGDLGGAVSGDDAHEPDTSDPAITGKVIRLPIAADSSSPAGEGVDDRWLDSLLDASFAPRGKRRTAEENELARRAAQQITQDWWKAMQERGTPISYDSDGKQFLAMVSMFRARLLQGYTVRELKNAMADLYRRRHKNFPPAQLLDDELVARRNGHANGAPVLSGRPGGRPSATDRAAAALAIGEKLAAEAEAGAR